MDATLCDGYSFSTLAYCIRFFFSSNRLCSPAFDLSYSRGHLPQHRLLSDPVRVSSTGIPRCSGSG